MDTLTPDTLAAVLQEPEKALLARVLKTLGQERCAQVLADTLQIENDGGMLTRAGDRRRSPGGVFFQLVKDRCTGKERYYLFTPRPVKNAPRIRQGTLQLPLPETMPIPLTLDQWKGLRPMPVTATLKLVLRDLPETRENGDMVYMALTHEPRGLPKGISLESGPLYLTAPARQWKTACTKAAEVRATGTLALLIVEAHVSTKEGALIGVVKGVQVVEGKAATVPSA